MYICENGCIYIYIYIYNLQGIKKNHKEQKSHYKIIPLSHMATVSSME